MTRVNGIFISPTARHPSLQNLFAHGRSIPSRSIHDVCRGRTGWPRRRPEGYQFGAKAGASMRVELMLDGKRRDGEKLELRIG